MRELDRDRKISPSRVGRPFLRSGVVQDSSEESGKFRPNLWAQISAWATLGLLLANLGLLYATTIAANAAKSSADTASATLVLTQRASLFIDNWSLVESSDDVGIEIRYTVRNAGNSAATIDATDYGIETLKLSERPNYTATLQHHSISVAKGASVRQPHVFTGGVPDALKDVMDTGGNWYFLIRLNYSDQFGKYRYCTVVESRGGEKELKIFAAPFYHCNE